MKKLLIAFVTVSTIVSCNSSGSDAEATVPSSTDNATTGNPGDTSKNTAALNETPAAPDPANNTTIEWIDGTTKDFGKIKEGEKLTVVFKFKNTGSKPLIFSDVHAGCGCTVAEKPEKPIAPGETGEIKGEFDSNNKTGMQSKNITATSNTDPAMANLVFTCEVKPKS